MDMVTIGYIKSYIKKSLIGLGMLRGSPCKVQSVVANYGSALDPTAITSHTVTLKYEGNPGQAAALSVTPTFQTKAFTINDANNIYSITYTSRDNDYFYYDITFLDGSTQEMKIPRVVQSTQMIVVQGALPDLATARQDAYYLLQQDPTKDVYIKYVKVLEEDGVNFTWLSLGSTDIDLSGYQKKIDNDIIKTYKNYDIATKDLKPQAKSVVGAINTLQKQINATYDDASGTITNLQTLHKTNLIDVANEHGNLEDLQFYDVATGKPDTLVDAINLANKDYEIKENTTVDRTKFVDTYKLNKDAKDGSPITQSGDTVQIPRVELVQTAAPETNDFRTYDLTMAGQKTDPNDTTNKEYGKVHIPSIKIAKIEPVTDPSFAAQYFLSIEGATTYDEAVAGAKIQLQKDLVIKDAGVKECQTAGVPLASLAVSDKYMYLEFQKPDGSSIFAYIDCKDLIVDSIGQKAIRIDYDSTQKKNVIKLVIYDPDTNEALVQTTDGLRIMNATKDQYGVVKYALQTEILSPSASVMKTITPYDVYNFAQNSTSVQDDLGSIYTADDGTKPNNTIVKAISEISTEKIQKRSDAVISENNISEYQLQTLPVAGVKRQQGDAIEIPKTILQVDTLTGVTTPKEYFLYYLKTRQDTNKEGLYEYFDAEWHNVGGSIAIQQVQQLPDGTAVPIYEDHFYLLDNKNQVLKRYSLSNTAIQNGVTMNNTGITAAGVLVSWAAVTLDWANYKDDQLVQDVNGVVYLVKHSDDSTEVLYDYENVQNELYYSRDGEWFKLFQQSRITIQEIDNIIASLKIQD